MKKRRIPKSKRRHTTQKRSRATRQREALQGPSIPSSLENVIHGGPAMVSVSFESNRKKH